MSSSCSKNTYIPDPAYEGCCPPQQNNFVIYFPEHFFNGTLDPEVNYKVYMPSLFTPDNRDGKNDYFYPQVLDSLVPIDAILHRGFKIKLTIYDAKWPFLSIFETAALHDLAPENFWNGIKRGTNEYYKGPFNWGLSCSSALGGGVEIRGTGCSVLCGNGTSHLLDKADCFLPLHGDENGNYIPKDPHTIENMDCFK
jgi:hypothetical protein